ncbi:lysophospholipase [Stieleria sp. TO1_6]|uniref:alpha/beta hydrolase n=1 Tax=Stieleria tagensis TaxID=2956795 RepID=UPI00209B5FC9|nr:lysophospholipase [Stieleria tagensis]MCO8121837.1 lysophospholipase [Stieleria tagensis]
MNQPRKVRYGSLDSYVIDGESSQPPTALVVLCHGYGAPGSDMVGVVGEWVHLLGDTASKVRFICPIAPHSLAELGMPSGRAWWALNMAKLMDAVQAERFDELHHAVPPGLDQARSDLSQLIQLALEELAGQRHCDVADIPLAMGGFSQGAMLTMDTAVRGDVPPPNLLMLFSGTVICQPRWTAALPRLENTHVYQAHGTLDPILPYASAERLRDLIAAAGIDSQFHSFAGPHTIDAESIVSTAMAIRHLVS